MQELILKLLDIFFFVFHTVLILFNVFGWIVPKWRLLNLILLLLTAFSWFFLGIWYGVGYCPFTDWHWQLRDLLGYQDMSSSYIHFLFLKLTSVDLPYDLVDCVTVIVFCLALSISVFYNWRSWSKNEKPEPHQ